MTRWSGDLEFAFRLADAADAVSTSHFHSAEMLRLYKTDGTPVSQVDLATEQAMVDVIHAEEPGSAVLGEEVGSIPGSSNRRWIIDGIDGTHNFAEGRVGWGTIVTLEVDGVIELGLVTAPVYGRRWWAERGTGAWSAPFGDDARFDPAIVEPEQLRCGEHSSLEGIRSVVIPSEGWLYGWRDDLTRRFPSPGTPRSTCFAIDTAMVAAGAYDLVIVNNGGVWDMAAPSLIVREAGGVFRDGWGGERFDTTIGVFTNAHLIEPVLDVMATMRSPEPDTAIVARNHYIPQLTEPGGDPDVDEWRNFGLRHMASMSSRVHVDNAPPPVLDVVDDRLADLAKPFVGVTTDGVIRPRQRRLGDSGQDTRPITDAALAFLQALTSEQRQRTTFDMDAVNWRTWINVHMNHFHNGLMIEELDDAGRELALDILRATLSVRGFHQARSIMRVNDLLAQLTGDYNAFGEWPYWMSIFGTPGGDEPWGWQFDGHHLVINTVVFDDQIVMTPTFMGAEPRRIDSGPLAGLSLFDPEETLGLDLIRSFDSAQRERAIIYPSLHPDEITPVLQNMFDGRMQAGAFHDNLVAPYQGVAGSDMSDVQRRLLLGLAGTYVGWTDDRYNGVRLSEVESHLDETWFSWYGGTDDHSPFYYRVHSPVILIEFDHHPGVAFANEIPTRHHVHSLVRTPNGGDYGIDLLRQHHERFDHSHGDHRPRP